MKARAREIQWSDKTAGAALHLVGADDHWSDWAACKGTDPEIFFSERPQDQREAASTCTRCPVRTQCLESAVAGRESGRWGGVVLECGQPVAAPSPARRPKPKRDPLRCRNGHLRTDSNTRTGPDGKKVCRVCAAARNRTSRERNPVTANVIDIRPVDGQCRNGHARTISNTRFRAGSRIECKDCRSERAKEAYWNKRKQEAA